MLSNHPDAAELIEAVQQHLEKSVLPAQQGPDAFHTRIAISVLGIVARECREGRSLAEEDRIELAALLNAKEGDDNEKDLVKYLQDGRLDVQTPGLLDYLKARTRRRLAIDSPRYRHEAG